MEKTLFPLSDPEQLADASAPLADRMRPTRLDEILGQDHLLGPTKVLREIIAADEIPSMIFWGPPGSGKTTLARVIAKETKSHFVALSAVLAGVKDIKQVRDEAKRRRRAAVRTLLFVDEIHRFNKAQQDAFLPDVESGVITLIGATTENPSFEVISPLLSRSRVLVLKPLSDEHLLQILHRALRNNEVGLGQWKIQVSEEVLKQMAAFANGDARIALNSLELAAQLARRRGREAPVITTEILQEALQQRTLLYDRAGEEHYNLISALHKSLRNSDMDASLYWLARMLEAGEDPLYIARRLVRFASEDVGLADPAALGYALDAMEAVDFIGMPEGKLALAQAVLYLAQAPKSNSLYVAYDRVLDDIERSRNDPVPLHLRNAPTALMKDLGYGKGYRYAHDEEGGVAEMDCLPESLKGRRYYRPGERGMEKAIGERLREIERKKQES